MTTKETIRNKIPLPNHSLSDLADSLATASNIAKGLGIDISQMGAWRRVIISNTLGHSPVTGSGESLLDATKDGVNYSYLSSHYGKRAQIYMGASTLSAPRKDVTFILAFFSDHDSSKILSMWSCDSDTIWKEVEEQAARKARKAKSKTKPKSQLAYFSEAWLRSKKGKGAELIFKNENL